MGVVLGIVRLVLARRGTDEAVVSGPPVETDRVGAAELEIAPGWVTPEDVIVDPEEERARVGVLVLATAVDLVTNEVIIPETSELLTSDVTISDTPGLVSTESVVSDSECGNLEVVLATGILVSAGLSVEVVTVGGIDARVWMAASLVDWRLSLVEAGVERLCVHVVGGSVEGELSAPRVPRVLVELLSSSGPEGTSEAVLATGLLPGSVELGAAGVRRDVVASESVTVWSSVLAPRVWVIWGMLVRPVDSGQDGEEAVLPLVAPVYVGSEVVDRSGLAWAVVPEKGMAVTSVPGRDWAVPVCPPDLWMAVCPAELLSPAGVVWVDADFPGEWVSTSVSENPEDVGVDLGAPESPAVKVCTRVAGDCSEAVGLDSSPEVVVCTLDQGTAEEAEAEKVASWEGVVAPRMSSEGVTVSGIDTHVRVAASLVDWRLSVVKAGVERLCLLRVGG
ncbi:hypothetical protein H920_15653 [Fukomys damarensis]|uniref:Uncharacterized protein n=1 Tax=Fukomys damarensis TaxID=885580 RepID=A0A091CXM2_FUKDA|nr:hypothetical protein H920_15653 [Fukomys damarensis]